METDWSSEWTPPTRNNPELAPETLAAVRALQGGEVQDSTRHLFAIFEPQLNAYFRRQGCGDLEADDLTQTVFIQMLEQIATLKDAASFHFWLFKMAGNYFRNFLRDRARDREAFDGFAELARKDSELGTFWVRGTFEPNPEAMLTVSEAVDQRRVVLRQLLQATRLAPTTRRSLLLRLQGASYEEIARELEIPVGTVGSQVSRAAAALLRNVEKIAQGAAPEAAGDAAVAEVVAGLSPQLLTFKREALEADPAYFRAGILEAASADCEATEERDEGVLILFAGEAREAGGAGEDKREDEPREVERGIDSPAAIAAVARQDRQRGRPRRRGTRTILPAGRRDEELDLGRLSRADLGLPLILLEEAAAWVDDGGDSANGGAAADGPLALRAKLTCVGALLARGRHFTVARRAAEIVRQATVLIATGRRDEVRHQVLAGRGLLRSYLGHNSRRHEPCQPEE